MGLLDNGDDLLSLGMGLLAAGGPSRTPVNFGQALAAGYGQMQQGKQQRMLDEQRQMQMEEYRRKVEQEKVQQAAIANLQGSIPDALKPYAQAFPQEVSKLMLNQAFKGEEDYTLTPGAARFRGGRQLAAVPIERKAPEGMAYDTDGKLIAIPGYVEMKSQIAAAGRAPAQAPQPYYQFLPTAEGYAVGNARTGGISQALLNGAPVIKGSDSPALQGRITGAKKLAETEVTAGADAAKAVKASDKFLSVASQAKKILDEGQVTQSGVGSAVDAAGRLVGYSSKSAQNSGELEAISGWLVSNVPRMEGPQSNFDVTNYQVMAGKIGDRSVPIAERKKALDGVMQLQEKYKSLNGGSSPASGGVKFLGFE